MVRKLPEIRRDDIHDRFVIIAPGRARRPHDVMTIERPAREKVCPFCKETILRERALALAGGKKNWRIKVIRNAFPVVTPSNAQVYGRQEIVIETPEHNKELADLPLSHIEDLLRTYANRTRVLMRDRHIGYILIFKNHGGKSGASLLHAHSQIFASGFLPPHIVHKLTNVQAYRVQYGTCYYCQLIRKEWKGPRHVFGDRYVSVFAPWASSYSYEAWIFPRRHVDNITRLKPEEYTSFARALKRILRKLNAVNLPYNYYLHQAVTDKEEHFYLRIAPRREIWGGIELGSRLIINPVSPEEAAHFYRQR